MKQTLTAAMPRIHPEVLRNTFKKADFMACLLELLKNSLDASAGGIWITTASKREFRVVDNGAGMDASGRLAYLNAGYSTGDGSTSAKFGTGARMLPFSYASRVHVSTVSAAEPGIVYVCEFTLDELLDYYTNKCDITWKAVRKSRASWPHQHPTGVDVTYTFEDASRRGILRGDTLRRRLTDRLNISMVKSGMVLVDGKRLPEKEYAPDTKPLTFVFENKNDPGMGRVRFEFYRPAKPRGGDLTMTARSVGEVSFRRKFVGLLPDDIRAQVPELFLQEAVCGLITADYLNSHVSHQRDEYQGAEDDARTLWLLNLLAQVEDQVAKALKISVQHPSEDDATGRKEVTALLATLSDRYQRPDQSPPSGGESEGKSGASSKRGGSAGGQPRIAHFQLNQSEFEVGEQIEARLVVSQGTPADFDMYTELSLAKVVSRTMDGMIRLTAQTIGKGKLTARHKSTGATVSVSYEIVDQRWFRLWAPAVAVVGERVHVAAYNLDKVPGGPDGLKWEVEGGDFSLGHEGRSIVFVPDRPGVAMVSAYATADPNIADDRDIQVNRSNADAPAAFCIRDEYFMLRFDGRMGRPQFSKPVTITRNEGFAHRLTFTPDEPGYVKASREGTLPTFLIPFIAREFADHFCEGDPDDGESYQWAVARLAAEVAGEMSGAREVVVE